MTCTKTVFLDINAAVMVQQNREHIAYIFKEFSQTFFQSITGAAQMFLMHTVYQF